MSLNKLPPSPHVRIAQIYAFCVRHKNGAEGMIGWDGMVLATQSTRKLAKMYAWAKRRVAKDLGDEFELFVVRMTDREDATAEVASLPPPPPKPGKRKWGGRL